MATTGTGSTGAGGGGESRDVTAQARRAVAGASDRDVKPGLMTSEFLSSLIAAIAILIAAAIADGFEAEEAWRLVAFLSIGYMISRGLAKLGSGRSSGPGVP